jgi:cytochrome b pre-mRNA-processing protein 3
MLGTLMGLFGRRSGNRAIVDRLHQAVVEAARCPAFYARWGVPDTLDGRFDCVTLHAVLLMQRMQALPKPADELANDVVDRLFLGFEEALRELGVGDVVIPKRMKTIAAAFLGRAKAYEEGMRSGDEEVLSAVLRRNLLGEQASLAQQRFWLDYLAQVSAALSQCDLDRIIQADHLFPDPA